MRRASAMLALILAACPPAADRLPRPDTSSLSEPVAAGIEQAANEARDNSSGETLGAYGELLHSYGFKTDAAECYRQAAALQPDEFRWPYLRGLALATHDPAAALRSFESARALDSDYAVLHFHMASLLQELERMDDARASLQRALALEDGHVPSHLMLGRVALSDGNLDQAFSHFERALQEQPDHPEAHECMAKVKFRLGRREEAAEHARIARDRPQFVYVEDPRGTLRKKALSHQDFNSRGLSRLRQGEAEAALKDFQTAIELSPDYAIAWHNLGRLQADLGQAEAAEQALRECLRLHPTFVQGRHSLVDLLARTSQLEEALALLDDWLAEALDPELGRRAARLAVQNGQPSRAVAYLQRLGDLASDQPATAAAVADLWVELGRPAEAAAILEEAVQRNPDQSGLVQKLALLCGRSGKLEEAVRWFRRLVELRPEDDTATGNLATACRAVAGRLAARDGTRALAYYDEALKVRPDWVPALRGAAWLLATSADESVRDPGRALALIQRALELEGRTAGLLDVLAAAHAAAGEFAQAVQVAEEGLAGIQSGADQGLKRRMSRRLELYRSDRPFRSAAAADDRE